MKSPKKSNLFQVNSRQTIITISGDLGSGKSTVCMYLEDHLADCTVIKTGVLFRKYADKLGLSIEEFNTSLRHNEDFDIEFDKFVLDEVNATESRYLVIDSRMAWHLVPNSLKVYIKVNVQMAAIRIFNDSVRSAESYQSVAECLEKIVSRRDLEKARYRRVYNVDITNCENYDLVLDSTIISASQVGGIIASVATNGYPGC